jgi:ATP/maltotriose-dependent transcriptional regulator MalT
MQQRMLLQTKLYVPPIPRKLVSHPRIIERLNAALSTRDAFPCALTLVSAPAGFGKTTLAVARTLIAQDRAAEALRLLTSLLAASQAAGRTGHVIRVQGG